MKRHCFLYLIFLLTSGLMSCDTYDDGWISSAFSCGIITSNVNSYSSDAINLTLRFFVLDKENSGNLTQRDVFRDISIYSSDFTAVMLNAEEITTPDAGKFSCAVMLDDFYSLISYETFYQYSPVEYSTRSFFKHACKSGDKVLFSTFQTGETPLTIYGDGFTSNADIYDLPLARLLDKENQSLTTSDSIPLLYALDSIIRYTTDKAEGTNKNILLLYSRNVFSHKGFNTDSIISRAKQAGIRVSTIMDFGGEYYVNYDLNAEDFFYKIANETGGFVYKTSDAVYSGDLMLLAAKLTNIMEGNFSCFESTWKISPESWTDPFEPGFCEQGKLDVGLQTSYEKETFEIPFGVVIQ